MTDRPRKLLLVVDAPSLLHRNHHARAYTRITGAEAHPAHEVTAGGGSGG